MHEQGHLPAVFQNKEHTALSNLSWRRACWRSLFHMRVSNKNGRKNYKCGVRRYAISTAFSFVFGVCGGFRYLYRSLMFSVYINTQHIMNLHKDQHVQIPQRYCEVADGSYLHLCRSKWSTMHIVDRQLLKSPPHRCSAFASIRLDKYKFPHIRTDSLAHKVLPATSHPRKFRRL